jgi:hypothetical protein
LPKTGKSTPKNGILLPPRPAKQQVFAFNLPLWPFFGVGQKLEKKLIPMYFLNQFFVSQLQSTPVNEMNAQ